jgi:hypothetical protein
MPVQPKTYSTLRICRDTEVARGDFRRKRLDEPLADYERLFPPAKAAADTVVNSLDAILTRPTDRALMSRLVGDKVSYSTLRSLPATPISHDDLETLLRASVNKTALKTDQALADGLSELLQKFLDPERFPWIAAARAATVSELEKAKLATAVLTAASAVLAGRRGDERKALEGRIEEILLSKGYTCVKKRAGGIQNLLSDAPAPGTFMKACTLGEHNADFVVCLRDRRVMAIECKASNSEVNGFKRLNKEVVVDAGHWYGDFGPAQVICAAALRGVFKPANVAQAQAQKVYLFWWHRMRAFEQFLDSAV